ncbi:MAG: NADPH:quinone oxidoreductase family protein [Acidimicrobiia bacterium]
MRAWRVHELGEPEAVLRLDDVDPPVAGPGAVTIDVAAASLNFPDVLMCRGEYQVKPPLPFTPGAEVAGFVIAVGDGVDPELVGRRVLAIPTFGHGGFTEQTLAPVGGVFPIPDSMGWHAAAALHVTYQTGYLALHRRAGLRAGETLLVHAGAGGVGSAAIQLGRAAGARVIATAGGPEKVQVCRDLGAEVVIDYRAGDFVDAVKGATDGRGADVIYDSVGGDTFDRSRKCVAFEGRILVIGFAGGRIADAPTNHALIKNYSIVGVHWGLYNVYQPARIRDTHTELVRLHAEGLIDPLVSRVVTMAEVPTALGELSRRGTWGKLVAEPAPEARSATRSP